jgi:hypothetical protein
MLAPHRQGVSAASNISRFRERGYCAEAENESY